MPRRDGCLHNSPTAVLSVEVCWSLPMKELCENGCRVSSSRAYVCSEMADVTADGKTIPVAVVAIVLLCPSSEVTVSDEDPVIAVVSAADGDSALQNTFAMCHQH